MLDDFRFFLIQRGVSQSTISLRLEHIQRLLDFCGGILTAEKVRSFIVYLHGEGRASSYINNYIMAIHLWGKCFKSQELLEIKLHRIRKESKRGILADEEIIAFLHLPAIRNSSRWYMWNTFWSICAYTAMRPGEVASLTIDQIDFGRSVIYATGKTGERIVALPPTLIAPIQEYIKSIETEKLFPGMNRAAWAWHFYERLKRLGIKRKGLVPYSFRHSAATRWIEEDINIFKVKKMLGHKRIATTEIYTHLVTKDIVDAIKKDRIVKVQQAPKDLLWDIYQRAMEISKTYNDKIYSHIEISEDGTELIVRRKVRI